MLPSRYIQNLITPAPPLHILWPEPPASLLETDVLLFTLASRQSILYTAARVILLNPKSYHVTSLLAFQLPQRKRRGLHNDLRDLLWSCPSWIFNLTQDPWPGPHPSHTGLQVHSHLGNLKLAVLSARNVLLLALHIVPFLILFWSLLKCPLSEKGTQKKKHMHIPGPSP